MPEEPTASWVIISAPNFTSREESERRIDEVWLHRQRVRIQTISNEYSTRQLKGELHWKATRVAPVAVTAIEVKADDSMLSDPRTILKEPGAMIAQVARVLVGARAARECVAPPIADMQVEYFDALSRSAVWESRFALLRGTVTCIGVMGRLVPGVRLLFLVVDFMRKFIGR